MPGTTTTTPATPAAGTTTTKATPAKAKALAYPLALPALQAKLGAAKALPHAVAVGSNGQALYLHCMHCAWAFSAPQARPNCQVAAACAKRVACLLVGGVVVLARNTAAVVYVLGAAGVAKPTYSTNGGVKPGTTPTVPAGVATYVRSTAGRKVAAPYMPWATARKPSAPAPTKAKATTKASPAKATKASTKATGQAKASPATPAKAKLRSGATGTTGNGTAAPAPAAPAPAPAMPAVLAGLTK